MEITSDVFKGLLLELSREIRLDRLLGCITQGLAAEPDVALARVWLIRPGEGCATCPRRAECPGHVPCLHLVSSAGRPRDASADWSRLDGGFRRFPIGVRKIGHVATGEVVLVERIGEEDSDWIARPGWAADEGIEGFGGVPLRHHGEVFGVLGVFTRSEFCANTLEWLEIVADHAAVAIANARAFEEIERLRDELAVENEYLREDLSTAKAFGDIVGRSPALAAMLERVALVATTTATVLIQGESGTGKELVAREIHRRSDRAEKPLIQVNCAAIAAELYESEFFGHARGAFTGATRERAGRFAAAHHGTLFLDEVGEIPIDLQGKLLRVLQEGSYERVGEERSREVDARVIAATNRDLLAEVRAGRFREDLYYRLNVFPIDTVPLRERGDDIALLAEHFVAQGARRLRGPDARVPGLSRASLRAFADYAWPGNVRELQNVIERALITWRGGPLEIELAAAASTSEPASEWPARPQRGASELERILTEQELRTLERDNLEAALRHTRWKVTGPGSASELLGLKGTTLSSRMRKLGLTRPW